MWILILLFSTFFLAPCCDACPPMLHIRNHIDGRQVEGFIVKKYNDKDDCNSNTVTWYAAPKDGGASFMRGPCELLWVTATLKVPITPPINIPIAGPLPSLTMPGNEEHCRTYVETNYNPNSNRFLYVKRNNATNKCFITTDP